MSEHRRKTLRSFYCEETLWQAFEKRSRELDSTIDQLINDALRQYLNGPAEPQYAPAAPSPAATSPAATVPQSVPARAGEHPTYAMPSAPRKMPPRPTGQMAPPPPPSQPPSAHMAPPPPPAAPAPPRPGQTGAVAAVRPGAMPTLFVHSAGRSYPVQTDRFIIGRGSQGTDLTIRDGNISRKHAAVIFHSGAFYMQDLGSTNGVEYNGNKIESKKIEEGDTFHICDHELYFSYRG